jgi:hypothetical protein
MVIAILFFNLASYSITTLAATRLAIMRSLKSNSLEFPSSYPIGQDQDWVLAAPALTKLCFAANLLLGTTSCLILMNAFFWWMTNASLVSSTVRNYALAYSLGAGIAGIVFVHVALVPRLSEGDGFLMAINSILFSVLAGLVFGTLE